jgi:hypothetical protein
VGVGRAGQFGVDQVSAGLVQDACAGQGAQTVGQARGRRVGRPRHVQPQAVRRIGQHLCRKEPVLGPQVPRTFPTQRQIPPPGRVEQHHGLDGQAAVLGAAETDGVDPGLPRHLGSGAIKRHTGIGEARPVEMGRKARVPRDGGEPPDLVERIGRAAFGDLRDAKRAWLCAMDAPVLRLGQLPGQVGRVDPAVHLVDERQFRAAGEELRRGAFVLLDMGDAAAEDAVIGLHEAGERQRIRRGAGGDEGDLGIGRLEEIADRGDRGIGHRVVAVGHGRALVGAHHRLHHLGMGGPRVVGGEIQVHVPGSSIT